jgi:hypothetical protein
MRLIPAALIISTRPNRAIRTPNMTQYKVKVIETGRSGRPRTWRLRFWRSALGTRKSKSDQRLVRQLILGTSEPPPSTERKAQQVAKSPCSAPRGSRPAGRGPLGKDGIKNRFPGLRV